MQYVSHPDLIPQHPSFGENEEKNEFSGREKILKEQQERGSKVDLECLVAAMFYTVF